jgi:hypothetical protein
MNDRKGKEESLSISIFSRGDFAAVDLMRSEAQIKPTELARSIDNHSKGLSTQLVALVNENHNSFLEASSGVQDLAKTISSLLDPLSGWDVAARKEIGSFSKLTLRVRGELSSIRGTRRDIWFLQSLFDVIHFMHDVVNHLDCSMEEIDLITGEYERVHAEIEAMESVLASSEGRGTPFMSTSLGEIREELARVRSDIITVLLNELETLCRTTNRVGQPENSVRIYKYLCRLQAGPRFVEYLKSSLSASIPYSQKNDDVAGYLKDVQRRVLHPESIWTGIAAELEPMGLEILDDVVKDVAEHELITKAPVGAFIPTPSNLEVFYKNYSACRNSDLGIVSKFKIIMYINLHLKRISDIIGQGTGDPQTIITVVISEILARNDVMLDDSEASIRIMQFIFDDVIVKIRQKISTSSWLETAKNIAVCMNVLLPRLKNEFDKIPFISQSVVERIISIETTLFQKLRDRTINKVVTDACGPIIQTLESVKQVPALYRVAATRASPTRHSVYVDLAIKAFTTWRDSMGDDESFAFVADKIVYKCVSVYLSMVADLVVRDKSRGGMDEKTRLQIILDSKKLYEFFRSLTASDVPTAELATFINQPPS